LHEMIDERGGWMQEKSLQGFPLIALLEISGLNKARVLVCQHELSHRIARTFTLLAARSTFISSKSETVLPIRNILLADQLVLFDFDTTPTDEMLTRLLERAADAGCAALVLHSDTSISFPSSWIQKAETLGLPILELPSDILPAELIAPLLDEFLRRERALLDQTTSVQERMAGRILEGKGGQGIVDLLFTIIGEPILLAESNGVILGQAGAWYKLSSWSILSNPDQLMAVLAPLVDNTGQWYDPEGELKPLILGQTHLFVKPVVCGKDVLGWFILNFEPVALDRSAHLALDQAAVAASLEISRQAAIRQVEWRLQAKFLDDLISSNRTTSSLEEQASRFGWDLRNKRAVMLLCWEKQQITPQQRRRLAIAVTHMIRNYQPESLVFERESEILILPQLPDACDPHSAQEIMQTLAQGLLNNWPSHLKNISVNIAIGGIISSLKEIVTSYHEARRALTMQQHLGLRYPVVTFHDVRIFSFLERHLEDDEAVVLIQRTIGPLIEYDAKHNTEFVRTAEVYFDCNYRLQQTADQLLIHPSSLKYRLQRIREILASDPFYNKDHLDYYLATKLARLL
jgi:purine catabolism regulator